MRVNAEPRGVRGIAKISEDGVRVLEILRKTKHAGAAPRTAIIEGNGIPACAANGLREIKIFFVARQAVTDDERRVRPSSGRLVDDAIDEHAVRWAVQDAHFGRVSRVGRRVGEDGGRNGLRGGGGYAESGEK